MFELKKAVIPAAGSVSNSIDLEDYQFCGFQMPAGWTAANITILAATSRDGTYQPVYQYGIEVTEHVIAGKYCAVENPMAFATLKYIKIRSGTETTPVNQAAEREIILAVRGE